MIHGTGSNFYGAGILAKLSEQAVQDGYAVLRINPRGHDLAATIPGSNGPVRGGAAYERVTDAQFDITAWADWLSQRSRQRIVQIGHSLGGVKVIWSHLIAARHGLRQCLPRSPETCQEPLDNSGFLGFQETSQRSLETP